MFVSDKDKFIFFHTPKVVEDLLFTFSLRITMD